MSARRWLTIAGLSCALLGALLAAWFAIAFLRELPENAKRSAERAAESASARQEASIAAAARDRADALRDDASQRELTPTVVSVEPRLEWPDVESLRRITQHGRILFGGIVYAPDERPCAGASVYCVGARSESLADDGKIATTDDHGAWLADVGRPRGFEFDDAWTPSAGRTPIVLGARKEGVGFAETEVEPESRRVDLHLHGGFAFKGTVVDNDDLRRVGGAELEASVGWFVEQTRADKDGDFKFPSLPSGGVELSGRAPGYDSNGSFPFNFDRGRDVEITFRLTKAFKLRGKFHPWPSPLVAAASATVLLAPRTPHGSRPPPTPTGAVQADGSFDVTLPVCPECTVELDGADGQVWQAHVDVNEEQHDVDLGTVELTAPAALTGRLAIPDASLRDAIEASAQFTMSDGKGGWLRQRLAADGSFRLAPLPAAGIYFSLELDGVWMAWNREASNLTPEERDESGPKLASGEVRDLGVIAPTSTIVYGTVRDGRGEPVALAKIDSPEREFASRWSDEEGRFCFEFHHFGESPATLTFAAAARGFAPRRVEVEVPVHVQWLHRDVVLGDGVALRGTLVDAAGAPLAGCSIMVEPGAAIDVTQADGSFEIRGFEAGEVTICAGTRGGATLTWKGVHPENGALTLRTSDEKPDSIVK